MSEATQPMTRKSIIRENAEKDPSYSPYCGPCPGLIRMTRVEPFLWRCRCGAIHDERRLGDVGPTIREDSPMPPDPAPRCNFIPPTPGYAPCTRAKGHDGPCAHPFVDAHAPLKLPADRSERIARVLNTDDGFISVGDPMPPQSPSALSALTADSEARGLYATTTVPLAEGGIRPNPNAVLAAREIDELRRLEGAATPAGELSMLQDRWIERRSANGEKYSVAEFEHEADQEFYFAARKGLPRLLATVDALTAERDALAKRCEEAEAVVGRLPVTADGVPIVPGMTVYVVAHDGVMDECAVDSVNKYRVTYKRPDSRGYVGAKRSACYSTRAAAESAAGKWSVKS